MQYWFLKDIHQCWGWLCQSNNTKEYKNPEFTTNKWTESILNCYDGVEPGNCGFIHQMILTDSYYYVYFAGRERFPWCTWAERYQTICNRTQRAESKQPEEDIHLFYQIESVGGVYSVTECCLVKYSVPGSRETQGIRETEAALEFQWVQIYTSKQTHMHTYMHMHQIQTQQPQMKNWVLTKTEFFCQ